MKKNHIILAVIAIVFLAAVIAAKAEKVTVTTDKEVQSEIARAANEAMAKQYTAVEIVKSPMAGPVSDYYFIRGADTVVVPQSAITLMGITVNKIDSGDISISLQLPAQFLEMLK